MKKDTSAIQFLDYLPSSRLGVLDIDSRIPLEVQEKCPACSNVLEPFCRLVGGKRKNSMRVGICSRCGYCGYVDRPTYEWVVTFYSRMWDTTIPKTRKQIKADITLPREGIKGSRYHALMLHRKLEIDRSAFICDVGSGYGQVLKNFEMEGYSKLIGVENSRHRAELVHSVFGYEIIHGAFGDSQVQKELKKKGNIGLFFSHHVLEHTYHPAQVIQAMSALQQNGDGLILALPNADGEHMNYQILYLPHLHAFTKESLEIMLNAYGYEIVADDSPDETNTIVAARKVPKPRSRFPLRDDYKAGALERLQRTFGLSHINIDVQSSPYFVKWEQVPDDRDHTKIQMLPSSAWRRLLWWRTVQVIAWLKTRLFKRFTAWHGMLIQHVVSETEVKGQFEVRFRKAVHVLIK